MTDFISDDELLARYITSLKWYRKSDQTVKPDAFVPPEDPLELSTTRHLNLSEDRICDIGQKSLLLSLEISMEGRISRFFM